MLCPLPQDTWQVPDTHTRPAAQAFPQAPQWALSVLVSRHAPAQTVCPGPQEV